ncbi:MAG: hypothetical protein AB7G93_00255 [Bdellovibrionales bacterium]
MHNQKTSVQFLGDHPVFVDGFPKDCDRSIQGALHLYPRRLIEITAAELSYLKDKRADVFKLLKVTPTPRERKESPKPQAPDLPKAEVVQEQPREEVQEEAYAYEKKWKKKGKGFEGV